MIQSQKQISELIKWSRFPLIVLVVMIHSHFTNLQIGGVNYTFNIDTSPIYCNVSYLVSDLIARIAVPLFYIFSGFLFFNNVQQFTHKVYFDKLRKRLRTIVFPYVFWNLVVVFMFFLLQTFLPSLASGANKLVVDYTLGDWVKIFWNVSGGGTPICYQFWFIRDLLVVILLSPIVYYAIKKFNLIYLGLLGLLWLFNLDTGITGISVVAFFFFSIGAVFAINSYDFIRVIRRVKYISYILSILLILILMVLLNMGSLEHSFGLIVKDMLYNICILSLIVSSLNVVSTGLEHKYLHTNPFLHDSNFFIYAYHAMPLVLCMKVLVKLITPSTDIEAVSIYFMAPFITIVVGLLLFALLKKILPKFTALITGSRV